MSGDPRDGFTREILRRCLIGAVREMVAATKHTAFSTCFAHGEDFTCALFDAQGRMVAQDQGVPVHAGSLTDAVRNVLDHASSIEPGDVFIHNDPYHGGTHQADGMVVRPMYLQHTRVGFAVNRGHWSDVGGIAPGGWAGVAQEVTQEGLLIPPTRLYSTGVLNADLRALILANVRLPRQLWGDIQSQIASTAVAERRVNDIEERFGVGAWEEAVAAALDYSARRMDAGLHSLLDGDGEAVDVIEDDGRGSGPLTIRVRVRKSQGRLTADFTGTTDQVAAPVNCTLGCTVAAVVAAAIAVIDPEITLNQSVIDRVRVIAPPGSLVHPTYPAPVFGTTADPVARVAETVLAALAYLAPGRVPAGSYATGNNVTGGGVGPDGAPFLWYSYQSGGCGARPMQDGNSAEWHLMANSKNESMEAWEARYPVEFLAYRLICDSGGAGRFRGGLGTERRFRLTAESQVSGLSDHHGIGARGVAGGGDGLPNGFAIDRGGRRQSLQAAFSLLSKSKFTNLPLRTGDTFVSIQGGGGGYGSPAERDAELIERDVRMGYVSLEAARAVYGYEDGA